MTSTAPITATASGEHDYRSWFMARRNRGRRDATRATTPEVISSWCTGTTLVEVVNNGGLDIETIETPNSPTCGGIPADYLVTEAGDRVTTEGGDRIILE